MRYAFASISRESGGGDATRRRIVMLTVGFVLVWLAWTRRADASDQPRMAVLEFDVQKGIKIDRIYFSDKVRSVLGDQLRSVFLMDRESTETILNQSGKSLADCTGSCEVETGRLLGADYVVSGRIGRLAKTWYLTLRLHATKDGRFIASTEATGATEPELAASVSRMVGRLVESLSVPLRSDGAANAWVGPNPPVPLGNETPFDQLDAVVRAAYESALGSEAVAEWQPEDAVQTWKHLAAISGANPYRSAAAQRAAKWSSYAKQWREFTNARYEAHEDVRRIMANASVSDKTKAQVLEQFSGKYGQIFNCDAVESQPAHTNAAFVRQCNSLRPSGPIATLTVTAVTVGMFGAFCAVSVDGYSVGYVGGTEYGSRGSFPVLPGRHFIEVKTPMSSPPGLKQMVVTVENSQTIQINAP
jgi:hypothetical protein